MDLLQLNTGDPALHDELTRAAIEAVYIDKYRDPEQKDLALAHFREAVMIITSSLRVFDTMDEHYEQMRALGAEEALPPRPQDTAVFRPDLFSADARSRLTYFTSIKIDTIWNKELYGEIEDMTLVYNEMVEIYMQNIDKMAEMSDRIEGDRDRYTILHADLKSLRTHIIELAKTLEYYCRHYPDDELREGIDAELLRKEKLLLKHFRVFQSFQDEGLEITIDDKDDAEIRLISLQAALSISQVLVGIAEGAKETDKKLNVDARGTKGFWDARLSEGYMLYVRVEDEVPYPTLTYNLKAVRKLLVRARGLTKPDGIGVSIDLNIERIDEALSRPAVSEEEAKRLINEGLERTVERIKREIEKEELEETKQQIQENEVKLQDAKKEGNKEEFDRLSKQMQDLHLAVDRLQQEQKAIVVLQDPEEREQIAADVISLALGRNAAKPLARALTSGNPMFILLAGATVAFLIYSGDFLLSDRVGQSKRKKRKRE